MNTNTIENVSRRRFLKGAFTAGALVLGVRFFPQALWAAVRKPLYGPDVKDAVLNPNLFVGIEPDGTVIIVAHRSEMGTGIRTSLPRVVADELDADWTRVKLQQGIGDARYGSQNTDGSHSVREFFDVMREMGGSARLMLVRAAAERWKVSPDECETRMSMVIHPPTGRKLGYGELASAAAKLPVPQKQELQFKPSAKWRYIGKSAPLYDLAGICTGKPLYGIDTSLDGMVYASVEHPPVLGGKVKSYDDSEARRVPGVHRTVQLPTFKPPYAFQALGGVAVIADNTWAAFQGRSKLKIEWDNGPNASYNSGEYRKMLEETARKPGKVARNVGDVDAAFAKGGKIVEAEYYTPHVAHAPMEPPNAVAEYRDGKVTAWAPTQNPQAVQDAVAAALGIKKENVICHVTLLGGAFGRKSMPDYVVEAALLSKAVGRPVKVTWRREDDIKFDYFHSVAAMYMKAALGENGKPIAWLQRSVFPSLMSTFNADQMYGAPLEVGMGWNDIPYDIPNLRVENGPAKAHVRIGWLRSVANIYHGFAVQSFSDELAHVAQRDPVEYLLDLIGPPRIIDLKSINYWNYNGNAEQYPIDTSRLRRVVEMVADQAGWGKRRLGKGSGLGIAAHRSFLTYVATVVEVEVNDKGEVKIPRVDTVVDAGLVVNPDIVRNQFEGAAVFGTSVARTGEITATNGVIDQSNFDSYPVARITDAPYYTKVTLVESNAPPAGVGEPGVPPFVPAFCNAIYAATGKRIRELPLSKYNFKA
jgi:isoquinoline 1-oxidoreductase beta subunit